MREACSKRRVETNVVVLSSLLDTLQERVFGRLESDVSKIREMIRTTTPTDVREMVRDLCNKLETTHRVHQDELLPQLHAMDTSVMCAVSTCAQHHTKLMERMRNKMYLVSVLQSRIRDQGVRLAAIRAAFDQTRDGMQELNHVRHMPKAYVASLREVAKRRAYKKRYVKKLEDFRVYGTHGSCRDVTSGHVCEESLCSSSSRLDSRSTSRPRIVKFELVSSIRNYQTLRRCHPKS